MIKRLRYPTYSYVKDGAVTVGCTLEVLNDDESAILATTQLECVVNITAPDFQAQVVTALTAQAQAFIDQLKVVASAVYSHFGTTDFDVAVNTILDAVIQGIEV